MKTTDVSDRIEALVREGFGPRQVVDLETVLLLARDAYDLGKLDGSREVATTCGLLAVTERQRRVMIDAIDIFKHHCGAFTSKADVDAARRVAELLNELAMPKVTT
jgi:hypothetical protein